VIIDAQVHPWAENRPDRPWPPGTSSAGHRLITIPTLLAEMDAAGVDRAVLVPPSWEGERNDIVLGAVRDHPDRFLAMGRVPLDTDVEGISRWREQPGMAGMRITAHQGPQRRWLTSEPRPWFWEAVEQAGLPVMLFAPGLIAEVTALLEAHPRLRLTLDHINLPLETSAATIDGEVAKVLPLARFPNLNVKVSALDVHTNGPARVPTIHRVVKSVVDAFGAERAFWGTDLTRNPSGYPGAISVLADGIPGISDEQLRLIIGEAISRWLPWPI
jgi:predicted TIM-barrel fold metal-dependent hydrolase